MRDDGFYYTSGGNKFDEKGVQVAAGGGLMAMAHGGSAQYNLGGYSDGGRLLRGPGDGVSDSIPATIGNKRPARLADGEFVVPARIVSELGNGSTQAGARKLYAMMDRVQAARRGTVGKGKVAKNSRADKNLPAPIIVGNNLSKKPASGKPVSGLIVKEPPFLTAKACSPCTSRGVEGTGE